MSGPLAAVHRMGKEDGRGRGSGPARLHNSCEDPYERDAMVSRTLALISVGIGA